MARLNTIRIPQVNYINTYEKYKYLTIINTILIIGLFILELKK